MPLSPPPRPARHLAVNAPCGAARTVAGPGSLAMALVAVVAGCRHTGAPTTGAAAAVEDPRAQHLPMAGLRDVALEGTDVYALAAAGLIHVRDRAVILPPEQVAAMDTLKHGPSGWSLEGVCPTGRCAWPLTLSPPALGEPQPLAPSTVHPFDLDDLHHEVDALRGAWNVTVREGWRVPFSPVALAPGGAPIILARGRGQLVRAGSPPAMVPIAVVSSPATLPAPFAMHPTGQELYVVSWPGAAVRAVDPNALVTRWSVELRDAAQGLFLDPGGRFLLVGEGPRDDEEFADWPVDTPASASATVDPTTDERLRTQDRPKMTAVAVVDLASHRVVARAPGSFRRWLAVTEVGVPSFLCATTEEILLYTPEPPP